MLAQAHKLLRVGLCALIPFTGKRRRRECDGVDGRHRTQEALTYTVSDVDSHKSVVQTPIGSMPNPIARSGSANPHSTVRGRATAECNTTKKVLVVNALCGLFNLTNAFVEDGFNRVFNRTVNGRTKVESGEAGDCCSYLPS